jgi:excisionase family DNA binding protein
MTREEDGMTQADELLTLQEVAAWLKVPATTLYQWRYQGEGPRGMRVGRYVRYRRSDVEAFIQERLDIATEGRPGGGRLWGR